jgi:hypothetical protein
MLVVDTKMGEKHIVFSERLFDLDKKTLLRVLKVRIRARFRVRKYWTRRVLIVDERGATGAH